MKELQRAEGWEMKYEVGQPITQEFLKAQDEKIKKLERMIMIMAHKIDDEDEEPSISDVAFIKIYNYLNRRINGNKF